MVQTAGATVSEERMMLTRLAFVSPTMAKLRFARLNFSLMVHKREAAGESSVLGELCL